MKLTYDLPNLRPDISNSLVYSSLEIPIVRNGDVVGQGTMSWNGSLELEISEAARCVLATGAARFSFIRTVVDKEEVVCGRNQRLVQLDILDNR